MESFNFIGERLALRPCGAGQNTPAVPEDTLRQTRQLVLIGGGHAHVAVLKAFGMQRLPEVRLVLLSTHWDTPYSGMLPAMIAGHYTRDEIHLDLHRLCRFAGGDFCRDRVIGLDLKAKQVLLAERPPIHFDLLSINTGSTPLLTDVPGARQHAIPVKPIDQLLARLGELEARMLAHPAQPLRVVTVGAGAGGVELTLSIQHRLAQLATARGLTNCRPEFTVITSAADILETHNARVRAKFKQLLKARGVRVLSGSAVVEVSPTEVTCTGGPSIGYDALLWATNAAAPEWPRAAGLAVDDAGFIAVNQLLQSTSHDFVYAAGDVAAMIGTPRPKSGVYAVRQGPPLAHNLRHAVLGFTQKRYRPQRTFLSLISTGDQQAVASKGPFAASGRLLWKWKQRIDRKWMRQYQELPLMASEPDMEFTTRMKANLRTTDKELALKKPKMRCGGCGAKIGGLILHEALKQLKQTPNPSVMIGLNAPDDAAVLTPPAGKLLVQSVDFFRTLINDPWLFGRIAANHALNDLYAMGATPMAGQATVTLELADDRIMVERLAHLLAGAALQLNQAGATLVGGHSAEGRETALGLTVTGVAAPGRLFRKTGLRDADCLVITKPIGTGVLFAADMELRLNAPELSGAVTNMLQSNAAAVEIFSRFGVTACTDISGFGLLGHVREMLAASDVRVDVWPHAIPLLAGATQLAAAGIESSMVPANAHYLSLISESNLAPGDPLARLLLDPQTAGPLLAAVPNAVVPEVLRELKAAGFTSAASIGLVVPGAMPRPFRLAVPS